MDAPHAALSRQIWKPVSHQGFGKGQQKFSGLPPGYCQENLGYDQKCPKSMGV